ncbi:MAG: hypothetical protein JWP97_2518 [Labilithrix sp.]|nr:hypothetical protein [Labilithrix sp.]
MILGVLSVVVGLTLAVALAIDWRRQRAFEANLEIERLETQRRHAEDELRRRMRDSFSEWPFPPKGDR